jgi:hypothetical protein
MLDAARKALRLIACELAHKREYRPSLTGRGVIYTCRKCNRRGWRP